MRADNRPRSCRDADRSVRQARGGGGARARAILTAAPAGGFMSGRGATTAAGRGPAGSANARRGGVAASVEFTPGSAEARGRTSLSGAGARLGPSETSLVKKLKGEPEISRAGAASIGSSASTKTVTSASQSPPRNVNLRDARVNRDPPRSGATPRRDANGLLPGITQSRSIAKFQSRRRARARVRGGRPPAYRLTAPRLLFASGRASFAPVPFREGPFP